MTIRMKIEGLKQVQVALRELPDATAKSVIRRVLRRRAKPIAEAARSRVPVDEGDLKDSIGVSARLSRRQKRLHKKGGPNDIEIFAGATEAERATWQLLGGGYAIEWPDLDEHIGVAGLLAGRRSGESEASLKQWIASRKNA